MKGQIPAGKPDMPWNNYAKRSTDNTGREKHESLSQLESITMVGPLWRSPRTLGNQRGGTNGVLKEHCCKKPGGLIVPNPLISQIRAHSYLTPIGSNSSTSLRLAIGGRLAHMQGL